MLKRLQRKFNILCWFSKGPTQTDLLLIDKCQAPKIEENKYCLKYEGVHYPLDENRYYAQILYDPTEQEYALKGNTIFLKLKSSKHAKKDAYKNK